LGICPGRSCYFGSAQALVIAVFLDASQCQINAPASRGARDIVIVGVSFIELCFSAVSGGGFSRAMRLAELFFLFSGSVN